MVGLPGIRGIRHKSLRLFRKTECLPNDEHVFEYRTDNEGYIREITVTTYDGQHQVSSKRIHTISYIDAN